MLILILIIIGIIFFSPKIIEYLKEREHQSKIEEKEANRKKQIEEYEAYRNRHIEDIVITDITTYQNPNISYDDIINLFLAKLNSYFSQLYYATCEYKVFTESNEQNYAWALKILKSTYGFGSIYNITFYFSNGQFIVKASDINFNSGGKSSEAFLKLKISLEFNACREEARIMWKFHGREPNASMPFNYEVLAKRNNPNGEPPPPKSPPPPDDMLKFYQDLLGLKNNFTQIELKSAYRESAEKYHPDRYASASIRDRENAETLMKQINTAYETLKNTL